MSLVARLLAACAPLALALPAAAQTPAAPPPERVLRVAPHADLRTLDPVFASILVTRMHGTMIYESLFSWDSTLEARPQMLESYAVTPDNLTWSFTLRGGLRFHDGQPVTTRDVIASLNRWMARDTVGTKLREYVAALEATDERRFTLRLSKAHGAVPFSLGSAVGQIPAIMRESDATSDPSKPVTEAIGSGPFRFNRAAWRPGAMVVYDRNPDYVPRAEPPDGLAGGRVVKVDRVEWHIMPDPATAAAALQTGEIDVWEQPAQDLLPTLQRARNVVVDRYTTNQALLRPNHLFPPFNDPRARLALAYLVDQGDALAAGVGEERWWRRCGSYFVCGSANGTEAGAEGYATPNVETAKRLLAEAGYRGEKVVLITTTDIPAIGRMAEVSAAALRAGGVNVDLQVQDWGSVTSRQPRRDPPDQGGWNLFVTFASGATMQSPITNIGTNMACERAWAGWPCDAEAERLRGSYVEAVGEAARRTAVEALHRRLAEQQPYRLLGQFDQPYARRANVSPLIGGPVMIFWNVEKQ
ncbi:ABC transporter substrate-binding protein [Roseomonas sp. OT10]|uniref:ABC transporter substrate-binding protein n=1 Tax=Roseomonas cutis TaxID=2897332 RepID=UPI001E5F5F9B|nr:ABC transporter substrate-binding protein [Roseomonas sp. OT10]UFN50595.1 ABC transporter substrate-binding protein [Roseomonas sp. OT10]